MAMIKPKPYKLKCPSCGYSKVVKFKSDALSMEDMLKASTTCAKCGKEMKRVRLGMLSSLFG